jgi:RNA polymerase sigma factor (sigma-70 family)
MEKNVDYVRLVEGARLGDKHCLDRLTELAEERLREDVGRITLNHDLTQDIVQETLLEMVKKLSELKASDRFWKWLTRIAFNKIKHHHRQERSLKIALESPARNGDGQKDSQQVVAELVSKEFQQIVLAAMRRLKPRHRAVLTLRCYRDMEYSQIAEAMGCSEFAAMMLFSRAKKALGRQLSRHGYGKGLLLPALLLFGKMTASSEAAAAQVSVAAAATQVSLAAGLVGLATSKTAIVSLTAAGVLAVGTIVATSRSEKVSAGSDGELAAASHTVNPWGQPTAGGEECWYFFPEGADEPVMMRLMKSDASGGQSYCRFLQNQHANYRYDNRNNTVHMNNCRMWESDLSVKRLPTDSRALSEFISRAEGRPDYMEYVSNRAKGLLVISKCDSDGDNRIWRIDRHFNVLEEEYFQLNWPESAKIIDNRDAMHKRGWTYFRITGRINGEEVSGTGRIPFVYAASKRFSPWLKLRLGDGSTIVDGGSEACVFDGSGKVAARYQGGSFFRGLGRPWMGLHTIDVVRRDAAEKQVRFETKPTNGGNKAEVVLTLEEGRMVYSIDMETDVIEKITFSASDGGEAELEFSYLQDIDDVGNEFTQPRIGSYRRPHREDQGMLWLVNFMNRRW